MLLSTIRRVFSAVRAALSVLFSSTFCLSWSIWLGRARARTWYEQFRPRDPPRPADEHRDDQTQPPAAQDRAQDVDPPDFPSRRPRDGGRAVTRRNVDHLDDRRTVRGHDRAGALV